MKRVGRVAAISAAVVASLVSFPAALPWMAAAWLGWHTWSVLRGRSGWPALVVCDLILLVKRTPWFPSVVALVTVMLAVALVNALFAERGAGRWRRRLAWTGLTVLWVTWSVTAVEWHATTRCGRRTTLHPTRPVVCLGDSLTAGTSPHGSYADDLAELLTVPVVNLGQDGITSAEALGKLPAVVEADPQVVVVELGGHDFLKGHGREATKANLERIIEACRGIGAEVVLMEVPRGVITDPYAGLERELARRHDLELVSDTAIRKLIFWSPFAPPGIWLSPRSRLSDDGLHPNARGNQVLAKEVAESLARLLGPRVRADSKHSRNGAKPTRHVRNRTP